MPAPSAAAAPAKAKDEPRFARATSTTRVTQRWNGDESDLDLYEVLSLDLGDARDDRWSGHLTARAAWDVDGTSDDPSAFASLVDSKGDRFDPQLFDAYVDWNRAGPFERVRAGRQFEYETPIVLWFDGVSIATRERGERRVTFGALAGVPVHAFESGGDDDRALGAFAEVHPWKPTRLRVDWVRLRDEAQGLTYASDLVEIGATQRVGTRMRFEARYGRLDGDDRDVGLDATWNDPRNGFSLRASYYHLLKTERALALELDPFFQSLFTFFPYQELRVIATKELGPRWRAQAGFDARYVDDEDDVGRFNRDFQRVFATASVERVSPWKLECSLTADHWDSDQSGIASLGADVTKRFEKRVELSGGSAFSLYKFDPSSASERESVRTWYGLARYRVSDALRLDVRYEFEDLDDDDLHAVRLGATWRF